MRSGKVSEAPAGEQLMKYRSTRPLPRVAQALVTLSLVAVIVGSNLGFGRPSQATPQVVADQTQEKAHVQDAPDKQQKKGEARSPDRVILSEKDFTFLGVYTVHQDLAYPQGGGELKFGLGFTHRYVDRELRFLTLGYISGTYRLVEFAAPAKLGSEIKTTTNVWKDVWENGQNKNGWWQGLWWDDQRHRLPQRQLGEKYQIPDDAETEARRKDRGLARRLGIGESRRPAPLRGRHCCPDLVPDEV
jgi:hypothetical protein